MGMGAKKMTGHLEDSKWFDAIKKECQKRKRECWFIRQ